MQVILHGVPCCSRIPRKLFGLEILLQVLKSRTCLSCQPTCVQLITIPRCGRQCAKSNFGLEVGARKLVRAGDWHIVCCVLIGQSLRLRWCSRQFLPVCSMHLPCFCSGLWHISKLIRTGKIVDGVGCMLLGYLLQALPHIWVTAHSL